MKPPDNDDVEGVGIGIKKKPQQSTEASLKGYVATLIKAKHFDVAGYLIGVRATSRAIFVD